MSSIDPAVVTRTRIVPRLTSRVAVTYGTCLTRRTPSGSTPRAYPSSARRARCGLRAIGGRDIEHHLRLELHAVTRKHGPLLPVLAAAVRHRDHDVGPSRRRVVEGQVHHLLVVDLLARDLVPGGVDDDLRRLVVGVRAAFDGG